MTKSISILATILALTTVTHAATNDLTGLLQQGLFEEEANRNLDAAISNYQSLANAFDKDRQVAATAIFRLGECYRKLGRTNEAAAQYQRIVRDFSDQQTLATLSRQNLAGLGASAQSPQWAQPAVGPESLQELRSALAMEQAGYDQKKTLLDTLEKLSPEEQKKIVPTVIHDPELNALVSQLDVSEQNFLQIRPDYGPEHPKYQAAKEMVDALNNKVKDRVGAIIAGLHAELAASQAHQQWLENEIQKSAASNAAQPANEQPPITDEEEKEIRRIQQLIQNSPDLINSPNSSGLTPLVQAAFAGWTRVATFLLDHGADPNVDCQQGKPLRVAARSGNKAMVELLLSRGADVNAEGSRESGTALHLAAENGFLTVADTLLRHNADVNARDHSQQRTPLHLASANARVEIIKLLLAHGADVNAKDEQDATPLSVAVHSKSLEAVNVILAAKPPVDVVDKTGRTPLAIAAANGDVEIAKALLAVKADPNAGAKNLPLIGAVGSGSHSTNLTALLLRAGADPNKVASVQFGPNQVWEGTAIELAVNYKEAGIVKLLLDYGADAKTKRGNGTLLHGAVFNIDIETAKVLLAKGADVNAANADGNTVLHYAVGLQNLDDWDANSNRLELAKVLLENNANPNVQNKGGKTPLDLLNEKIGQTTYRSYSPDKIRGQKAFASELADLLRKHGALDELPDFSAIRVTREGLPAPVVVFQRQSNDWNNYTLLETLLRVYTSQDPPNVITTGYPSPSILKFPDLTRIIIHRPDRATAGKQTEIKVNLLNTTNGIDCGKDIPLEFGDVVEIPARDYTLGEMEIGLSQPQLNGIVSCTMRKVRLNAHGESRELTLYSKWAYLSDALGQPEARNLLLASSDLTRVKVSRKDPLTGKAQEFVVDSTRDSNPFLKDGDVIEVPEKARE